jgi:proteasome lid subunit RPN8/RPN11
MIAVELRPWTDMVAHARAAFPNECCGAMIGMVRDNRKVVRIALPLRNASGGMQNTRYQLRPEDLMWAGREARKAGLQMIGIYHSHPDSSAYFSAADLKNSCPWYSFVVLSIMNGEFNHACSWLPSRDRSEAVREELIY